MEEAFAPEAQSKPTDTNVLFAARQAKEAAVNYQTLLRELVTNGLYEDDNGLVRVANTEGEKVDMRAKLLDSGHELGKATAALEELEMLQK